MIKENMKSTWEFIWVFIKWIIISVVTGGLCGGIGAIFHLSIDYATELRGHHPWLLYLLPLGGLLIVFIYKIMNMDKNGGTNNVINSVKDNDRIPWKLAPSIFIGTVLTHLLGGSSGREGAALQLGGSIGEQTARIFRQDKMNRNIVVMCGMSGLFSALFGTPVTATVFVIEVVSVGIMYYSGIVPCIISSVVAFIIAGLFGIKPVSFVIDNIPPINALNIGRIIILASLCALVSIIFCIAMKRTSKALKTIFKNAYLRAAVGGLAVILLTLLVRTYDYNGAGMDIVAKAIEGNANWYDFILKIIFTAITIGAGFKGGEIVPTFFIGATFGCFAGSVLGLDAGFSAALGLVALFCGVVNCPLASIILSIELFGAEGIIYFALASGISYMLSGYYGLYSSQDIAYSKLRVECINRSTK